MATKRSLYDILNVSPTAEGVVIEAAYRALMKKYHPDHLAGSSSEGSAAEINQAFAILRDPDRRADYDRRQWVREQEIALAPYSPPPTAAPRRRALVFGWSGWIVAAVLGGILAALAGRASELAEARAAAEREAIAEAPDLRSQPILPEESLVPPAVAAEIRAAALTGKALLRTAPAAESPKRATSQVRTAPPRPRPTRIKPRPDKPAAARRSGGEREFLEREGYIY